MVDIYFIVMPHGEFIEGNVIGETDLGFHSVGYQLLISQGRIIFEKHIGKELIWLDKTVLVGFTCDVQSPSIVY